jgi:hypothetical protein
MKIKIQIFGVIVLTIGLLVSALPPTASATSTPFNGSCEFFEELPSPDLAEWWTNQNELHIRDEIQTFMCDFSDDRLDGVYRMVINWDVRAYYDPFFYVIGRDYGLMTLADENGDLLWEGLREYDYTPPRTFMGKVVLHGRGPYAGLTAKMDVWGDFWISPIVQLAGNIYNLR